MSGRGAALPPLHRFDFRCMGSPCSLQLECRDEQRVRVATGAVLAEVRRLEQCYSRFLDDSLLARINREASEPGGIELTAEPAALIDYAFAAYHSSGGVFDITAGVLTRLWDPRQGQVPEPAALAQARALVGMDKLDWRTPRLRMRTPGMGLDLGGLVKEYAVDRAALACREAGVDSGVVELGGDLVVLGPHADGTPWRIGIRDPLQHERALAGLDVLRGAVATSGDYERHFEHEGRRYSHLVDPRSGEPVRNGLRSVSVNAPDCLVAGTASTIAMLLGEAAGLDWLERSGLSWLAVTGAGQLHRSGVW